MRDSTRLIGTLIIWLAFTITVSTTFTTVTGPMARASETTLVVTAVTFALAALVGTLAVWLGGERAAQDTETVSRKAKRVQSNRLERLIEALDDDEIYDLEALLLSRDRDSAGRDNGVARRRQDV